MLERMYASSNSVEELASRSKAFDLKASIARYAVDKRITHLEIGMRTSCCRRASIL